MRYIITQENKTYFQLSGDDGDKLKFLHCLARYEGVDSLKRSKTCFKKYGWDHLVNHQFDRQSQEEEDSTLLSSAVIKGCEERVSFLIKKGALIDLPHIATLRTPLHDSVGTSMEIKRITEILLPKGSLPKRQGYL